MGKNEGGGIMNIVLEVIIIFVGIQLLGWQAHTLAIFVLWFLTKTIGWFFLLFIKKSFEVMINNKIGVLQQAKKSKVEDSWEGE